MAARVKALGVSGQQHGLVALDAAFNVIRPGEGRVGPLCLQLVECPPAVLPLPPSGAPPLTPCTAAPAAKLWCDVESAEEAAELSRLYGFTLVPSFTGAPPPGCPPAWLQLMAGCLRRLLPATGPSPSGC